MIELNKSQIDAINEKLKGEQDPEREKNVKFLIDLNHSLEDNEKKSSAAENLLYYLEHGTLLTEAVSLINNSLGDSIGYR
jgi:hypothetical protein